MNSTVHRFVVGPADVGEQGVVDGATVLEWCDGAARTAAWQWCGQPCAATAIGDFHLDLPITVGARVMVQAAVVHTSGAHLDILVTLQVDGTAAQTAQCTIVFAAAGPVPVWAPATMLELQRHRQARKRARVRSRIEDAMPDIGHLGTDIAERPYAGPITRRMDEAACACGTSWTGSPTVMSYLAGVGFHGPAHESFFVATRLIHTGPRSVHVAVQATAEKTADLIARAVVVVVSLDASGAAESVPLWRPGTGVERQLDAQARRLIEMRALREPCTTAVAVPA